MLCGTIRKKIAYVCPHDTLTQENLAATIEVTQSSTGHSPHMLISMSLKEVSNRVKYPPSTRIFSHEEPQVLTDKFILFPCNYEILKTDGFIHYWSSSCCCYFLFGITFQTSDSNVASYVAGPFDQSFNWKVI